MALYFHSTEYFKYKNISNFMVFVMFLRHERIHFPKILELLLLPFRYDNCLLYTFFGNTYEMVDFFSK